MGNLHYTIQNEKSPNLESLFDRNGKIVNYFIALHIELIKILQFGWDNCCEKSKTC